VLKPLAKTEPLDESTPAVEVNFSIVLVPMYAA